jgi:hypothetical protein
MSPSGDCRLRIFRRGIAGRALFGTGDADGKIWLAAIALLSMLVLGSSAVATTFSENSSRTPAMGRGSDGPSFELSDGHRRSGFIRVTRLRIIVPGAIAAPSTARYLGIVGADSAGKSLDGKSRYRLHFASADVPSRDTEWSLAPYPTNPFHGPTVLRTQWIGSNSNLRYNPDGSLDIAISISVRKAQKMRTGFPHQTDPST